MIKKTKAKDWVRSVRCQASGLSGGASVLIELGCIRTGERHFESIGRNCWEDDYFRCGYEEMQAEDGFAIVGIGLARGPVVYGYSEGTRAEIDREPHDITDFASSQLAIYL